MTPQLRPGALAACLLGLTTLHLPATAQGLLQKLADKAAQKLAPTGTTAATGPAATPGAAAGSGLNADDQRQADQDRADPTLDTRPLKADKRGVGGIYHPNFLLGGVSHNHEKSYVIAKVLVEYDDATGVATMFTRHAFEANDPSKLVPKAAWTTTSMNKQRTLAALAGSRYFLLREAAMDNRQKYKYGQMRFRQDLQNNWVADKLAPEDFSGGLLELEPGVLYVGTAPYAGSKTEPYGHNLLNRPGLVLPLLVKPGKEAAAQAWTAEKIIAQYRAAQDAYDQAFEDSAATADPNLALREPSTDLATRAELDGAKAQWQRVIADRNVAGTQTRRSFKLAYAYPATAWEPQMKKQLVNNSYVDTVVSRSRVYVAVFQDQEAKYWTNRFYLVEKTPPGEFFGQRWTGLYDYALPASAVPVAIGAEAALKYQPVRTR